jgi:hypothetical protein
MPSLTAAPAQSTLQIIPALDPATPVFAGGFVMALMERRLREFSLWDPQRFKRIQMGTPFQAGPFECGPVLIHLCGLTKCCLWVAYCMPCTLLCRMFALAPAACAAAAP